MIKRFLVAIATVALLAVGGCTLTPEVRAGIAKTCSTGITFYGYIQAANTTGVVPAKIIHVADQAYGVLKPICDKGAAVTETDIVIAAAQVYILTKAWRDAS